jgi:hypothetical protein
MSTCFGHRSARTRTAHHTWSAQLRVDVFCDAMDRFTNNKGGKEMRRRREIPEISLISNVRT